jgi:adenylate cyclase
MHNNNGIGVLCLHATNLHRFNNNAKHFFSIVADQIATAIILFRLYNNMLKEENRRYILSRFFSKGITETILNQGEKLKLGGERKNVTILFADLCGFTSMSEKLDQEEVRNILHRYFSFAIPIVFEVDGTLDKLMGDGMMAFFGAPISHIDDPARALKMAIRLISALKKSDIRIPGQTGELSSRLKVSVGINTGEVVAGYLGSEDHLNYTVIGDAVNIAQRLQTLANSNEIFISRSTFSAIKDTRIDGVKGFTHLKGQKVKGRHKTVDTYRVELTF